MGGKEGGGRENWARGGVNKLVGAKHRMVKIYKFCK